MNLITISYPADLPQDVVDAVAESLREPGEAGLIIALQRQDTSKSPAFDLWYLVVTATATGFVTAMSSDAARALAKAIGSAARRVHRSGTCALRVELDGGRQVFVFPPSLLGDTTALAAIADVVKGGVSGTHEWNEGTQQWEIQG